MRIRTRLTLYFTGLVLIIITLRIVITYTSLSNFTRNEFYHRLHAKALTTASLLFNVQDIDSAMLKKIDRAQNDVLLEENVSIYDSTNRLIYTNNDTVYYPVSDTLFEKIRTENEIRYKVGEHDVVALVYNYLGDKMVVTAGAINRERERMLSQLIFIYGMEYLIFIFVILIIGWFFVGKALEPISNVVRQANTLSPVEKSERLPERIEKDEVSLLINTFNNLFDKLEESFKHQKNFVANVTHELNNPLTRIKSQLEVSLYHEQDNEQYKQTLQSILEDVNEQVELVQDLLNLSKLSAEHLPVSTPIRVDELLFEVRENILRNFPGNTVLVDFLNPPENEKSLICFGNKALLATAFKNIVENACKFSPDKSAKVTLQTSKGQILVVVADKGPGISQEDLPKIFEIFYRNPSLETVKGFGIGLALAKRIFDVHGFSVEVQSVLGEGTTLTIQLSK